MEYAYFQNAFFATLYTYVIFLCENACTGNCATGTEIVFIFRLNIHHIQNVPNNIANIT